jgi:hypothetical protein
MAVLHSSLTGSDLHEPKGIATAPSGSVYQATGGGTGSWSRPTSQLGPFALDMTDIASAVLVPFPYSVRLTQLVAVIDDEITASGELVTVSIKSAAGVVQASASFTVATASKGTLVSIPLDLSVAVNSYIELAVTAGGTSPAFAFVSLSAEKT